MSHTLDLTPVEAAIWRLVEPGGVFHLVRNGVRQYVGLKPMPSRPPAEFVQACAPCETCGGKQMAVAPSSAYGFRGGKLRPLGVGGQTMTTICCPDCRIDLVGPCSLCGGSGKWVDYDFACNDCEGERTITLGHGYALGEPLLIVLCAESAQDRRTYNVDVVDADGKRWMIVGLNLAHYGDPSELVGKWLLRITKAVS